MTYWPMHTTVYAHPDTVEAELDPSVLRFSSESTPEVKIMIFLEGLPDDIRRQLLAAVQGDASVPAETAVAS